MRNKITCLVGLLMCLSNLNIYGQCDCPTSMNLVPNPGLEEVSEPNCSTGDGDMHTDFSPVADWIGIAPEVNGSTPDYHHPICSGAGSISSCGPDGVACAGFYASVPGGHAEFIQVKLKEPLIGGREYCFSFQAKSMGGVGLGGATPSNNIGFTLSPDSIVKEATNINPYYLDLFPPYWQLADGLLVPADSCATFTGSICAEGGEQWMCFGGFRHFQDVTFETISDTMFSYIVIDNVSLKQSDASYLFLNLTTDNETLLCGQCATLSPVFDYCLDYPTVTWTPSNITGTDPVTVCPLTTTSYTFAAQNEDACSVTEKSRTITIEVINPNDLTATFTSEITGGCETQAVQFNTDYQGTGFSYLWDFGDGTTADTANPSHSYATSGNYEVSFTITYDGGTVCDVTATDEISEIFNINVFNPQELVFEELQSVCNATPSPFILDDLKLHNYEGIWTIANTPAGDFPASIADGQLNAFEATTGIYTLNFALATPPPEACQSEWLVDIEITDINYETVHLPTCEGTSTTYEGQTIAAGNSVTIETLGDSGCGTVTEIFADALPSFADSIFVDVCEGEQVNYEGYLLSAGESMLLEKSSQAGCDSSTYLFAQAIFPDSPNAAALGCLPSILITRPTAFSPNGDGVNDVFRLIPNPYVNINTMDLQIYDRWGNVVFQSADIADAWDGTYKGRNMPLGVYVFFARVVFADGTAEMVKGNVSLVR